MRFKRITFNWTSPMIGLHIGKNPVSGQRFAHWAPLPFIGVDFEFPPYVNDEARKAIYRDKRAQERADARAHSRDNSASGSSNSASHLQGRTHRPEH